MSDAIALLEECVSNGDRGVEQLYAWFRSERNTIMQIVLEARFEENE
ncbi:MAG: hypothetical protein KAS36_02815 [Anaerolineales bacterium]|nr:hypothetical protein [Anaerolineales bacterium]